MKRHWQYSRIGRVYEFSAAHRLPKLPATHKCHNLHGHNYVVEIEVRGDTMDSSGFCLGLDFAVIDKMVKPVIDRLDHSYLNDTIENPTAENIAQWLLTQFADAYVYSVKVWETPRCWAMAVNPDGLFHAVHKE